MIARKKFQLIVHTPENRLITLCKSNRNNILMQQIASKSVFCHTG
nr:MAG TPA: hypothetical protein [Caudoviricetes sp.]